MSREIKFRAWDKKNNRWIHSTLLLINNEGKLCCCYSDKNHGEWAIDYELSQYTGLKDKNGKEIYEGDVATQHKPNFVAPGTLNGKVWFQQGCFWLGDGYGGFSLFDFINKENGQCNFEIIGNIYENPDLIK